MDYKKLSRVGDSKVNSSYDITLGELLTKLGVLSASNEVDVERIIGLKDYAIKRELEELSPARKKEEEFMRKYNKIKNEIVPLLQERFGSTGYIKVVSTSWKGGTQTKNLSIQWFDAPFDSYDSVLMHKKEIEDILNKNGFTLVSGDKSLKYTEVSGYFDYSAHEYKSGMFNCIFIDVKEI